MRLLSGKKADDVPGNAKSCKSEDTLPAQCLHSLAFFQNHLSLSLVMIPTKHMSHDQIHDVCKHCAVQP